MKFIGKEEKIQLPESNISIEYTLLESLKARQSERKYKDEDLTLQEISDLLWAMYGINRDDGKRTAPLLWDVGIYIAHKNGIFKHNPADNSLIRISEEDGRSKLTDQEFIGTAPLSFILTINADDMTQRWVDAAGGKDFFAGNQLGAVSQNLYLCAAAMKLATVAASWINYDDIAKLIKLKGNEKAWLIQTIGRKP